MKFKRILSFALAVAITAPNIQFPPLNVVIEKMIAYIAVDFKISPPLIIAFYVGKSTDRKTSA